MSLMPLILLKNAGWIFCRTICLRFSKVLSKVCLRFSNDSVEMMDFLEDYQRQDMLFSGQFIRGYMSSICLITVDSNLNQLVRVVSARILHCKDRIFPFVIHKYLGGYFEVMYIFCFFFHFNQFYYSSCLQQLLLWFFNSNLLFPTSLLHLLF